MNETEAARRAMSARRNARWYGWATICFAIGAVIITTTVAETGRRPTELTFESSAASEGRTVVHAREDGVRFGSIEATREGAWLDDALRRHVNEAGPAEIERAAKAQRQTRGHPAADSLPMLEHYVRDLHARHGPFVHEWLMTLGRLAMWLAWGGGAVATVAWLVSRWQARSISPKAGGTPGATPTGPA